MERYHGYLQSLFDIRRCRAWFWSAHRPSLHLLTRPLPKGSTDYVIASRSIATWGLVSQSGRAVIRVTDTLPSAACVNANAHALARYASLCQEQELVPIVEPEVLMDGSHPIGRCEEVTSVVLHAVFGALFE